MAVIMRRGGGKPAVALVLLFQDETPDRDPCLAGYLALAAVKDDRT